MENNNETPEILNRALFSYCKHPNIKFETHESGEKIILLLRAHPFTQIYWVFNSILLLILLLSINFVVSSVLTMAQVFIVNCFGLVFIASYLWFSFLNWYFNVGIVTTRRIIDIDFSNILYKQITVARLDRIEDITSKSGGYFEAFFDYGTIFIQTAGTEQFIEFPDISYPSDAIREINKLLTRKHGP